MMKRNKNKVILSSIVVLLPMVIGLLIWNQDVYKRQIIQFVTAIKQIPITLLTSSLVHSSSGFAGIQMCIRDRLCALVALVVVAIKMFMDGLIAGGLICLPTP